MANVTGVQQNYDQDCLDYEPTPHLTLSSPTELLISPRKSTFPRSLADLLSSPESFRGKTVVVTGGASGIGEATARKLVSLGANVIIGDINTVSGNKIVKSLSQQHQKNSQEKGEELSGQIAFFECDVTRYESQVEFFKKAMKWAGGRINSVIVNAGILEQGILLDDDGKFDCDHPPPPPNLITYNVNLIGAIYTVRLAHHFLRHSSTTNTSSTDPTDPTLKEDIPDRHILLIGSYSSFVSAPLLPLYSTAKHGLLGLFSSLRMSCLPYTHIRINLICPYFVHTPLMPIPGKLLLAGQQTVNFDDLVNTIVRTVADRGIMGRMIAVGPQGFVEDVDVGGGMLQVEAFGRRVVRILNARYWGKHWWERWGRTVRDVVMIIAVAVWTKLVLMFWG